MGLLENDKKEALRMRFAAALDKAKEASEFASYRELARGAGMDRAHLQKIAAGKKDIELSTLLTLISAIGLSLTDFGKLFEALTEADVRRYREKLAARSKEKGKKRVAPVTAKKVATRQRK